MTSVLVVDDSQFMRTVIGDILADNGYEVYRARDGERAVEAVQEYDPDIVTMDVQMPGIDGIEAVERIMATDPTRILMLSAYTQEGADATLKALSSGAIGFLAKPSGEVSTDIPQLEDRLLEAIEAVEHANVSTIARSRTAATARRVSASVSDGTVRQSTGSPTSRSALAPGDTTESIPVGSTPGVTERTYQEHPTVVVGASTGGPTVIEQLLHELPIELDARVLIVQHMPPEFTGRFAKRLDTLSAYDVTEAKDGDRIRGGQALIAHGDSHMRVAHAYGDRIRVRLSEDGYVNGVRPSIDVTMESAARAVDPPLVGLALTGMGKDGADGIRAIKEAGGTTIVQDRETSPVFGIPKQAIETGAVDRVLPADRLGEGVLDAVSTEVTTDG